MLSFIKIDLSFLESNCAVFGGYDDSFIVIGHGIRIEQRDFRFILSSIFTKRYDWNRFFNFRGSVIWAVIFIQE